MNIPDRKIFMKEVESLTNEKVKERLIKVYEAFLGKEDKVNLKKEAKDVLKELFKKDFSKEIDIPFSFLDTTIAKLLFGIMYATEEKQYTMGDLVELTGYTRQYLWQEIESKNLKGDKVGGRWRFNESEVKRYMQERYKK